MDTGSSPGLRQAPRAGPGDLDAQPTTARRPAHSPWPPHPRGLVAARPRHSRPWSAGRRTGRLGGAVVRVRPGARLPGLHPPPPRRPPTPPRKCTASPRLRLRATPSTLTPAAPNPIVPGKDGGYVLDPRPRSVSIVSGDSDHVYCWESTWPVWASAPGPWAARPPVRSGPTGGRRHDPPPSLRLNVHLSANPAALAPHLPPPACPRLSPPVTCPAVLQTSAPAPWPPALRPALRPTAPATPAGEPKPVPGRRGPGTLRCLPSPSRLLPLPRPPCSSCTKPGLRLRGLCPGSPRPPLRARRGPLGPLSLLAVPRGCCVCPHGTPASDGKSHTCTSVRCRPSPARRPASRGR